MFTVTDYEHPRGDQSSLRPRREAKPPVLDVLPYELRRESAPEWCFCRTCAPDQTDAQRAAHERVERDFRATRQAWCDVHGYLLIELIRAETDAAVRRSHSAAEPRVRSAV